MSTARTVSLGFTHKTFAEGQHILYVYNDEHERSRNSG